MMNKDNRSEANRGSLPAGGSVEGDSPLSLQDMTYSAIVSPGLPSEFRFSEKAEKADKVDRKKQGGKTPVLTQADLEEQVREHFSDVLGLSGEKIDLAVTEKWLEIPKTATKILLREAESKTDKEEREAAFARQKAIEKAVDVGLAAIEGSKGGMTPGKANQIESPFWGYVGGMAIGNLVVAAASAGVCALYLHGSMSLGLALTAFGVASFANRLWSWRKMKDIDNDFDSTVRKAFRDALKSGNNPVKQIVYTAALACMVQKWKNRGVVMRDSVAPLSSDKDGKISTGMEYLKNAITQAMISLYGQGNGVAQAMKDPLFDQILEEFSPFLDKLKTRWGIIPRTLDVVASGVGYVGLMSGAVGVMQLIQGLVVP